MLVREVFAGCLTTPKVVVKVDLVPRLDKMLAAGKVDNLVIRPPVPEVMEVQEVQRVHLTCKMPTMEEVTVETAHHMEDADKAPLHGNLVSLPENFMLAAVALFVSITTTRDMVMEVTEEGRQEV